MKHCKSVNRIDNKYLGSASIITVAHNLFTQPATVFTLSRIIALRPDDPSDSRSDQTEYLFK